MLSPGLEFTRPKFCEGRFKSVNVILSAYKTNVLTFLIKDTTADDNYRILISLGFF